MPVGVSCALYLNNLNLDCIVELADSYESVCKTFFGDIIYRGGFPPYARNFMLTRADRKNVTAAKNETP